jgi:hypothetical protein
VFSFGVGGHEGPSPTGLALPGQELPAPAAHVARPRGREAYVCLVICHAMVISPVRPLASGCHAGCGLGQPDKPGR